MLAIEKIHKAIESCQRALDNLEKGNKRASIGDLDYVKENAQEAIYLILSHIKGHK